MDQEETGGGADTMSQADFLDGWLRRPKSLVAGIWGREVLPLIHILALNRAAGTLSSKIPGIHSTKGLSQALLHCLCQATFRYRRG
jgi:hypothetical protein